MIALVLLATAGAGWALLLLLHHLEAWAIRPEPHVPIGPRPRGGI